MIFFLIHRSMEFTGNFSHPSAGIFSSLTNLHWLLEYKVEIYDANHGNYLATPEDKSNEWLKQRD